MVTKNRDFLKYNELMIYETKLDLGLVLLECERKGEGRLALSTLISASEKEGISKSADEFVIGGVPSYLKI